MTGNALSKAENQAQLRQELIAQLVNELKPLGKPDIAVSICKQAGLAEDSALGDLFRLVDGLVKGTEHPLPSPKAQFAATLRTFGEFAEMWTSNDLAQRFRGRVKAIDHEENRRRLKNHILGVEFQGRKISDTPLNEFTLDHADFVLAQPSLPDGSVRHVAQVMHRLLKLAVHPARLLKASPFPPGWLPPTNSTKERGYLFPGEEAKLLAATEVALVRRLFFGFCSREGMRRENAATLTWSNLTLDLPSGEGHIVLDRTKNNRGGSWRLDPGTAEALRRWQRVCPSSEFVFPTEAVPQYRRSRSGKPMYVEKAANDLRQALTVAGVTRPKLFENSKHRQRLRAHDLRATFVTLALAKGETEDWVRTRTGHCSSSMIARYRREAATAEELNLGWLKPLHEAIPELAEMASPQGEVSANCRQPLSPRSRTTVQPAN